MATEIQQKKKSPIPVRLLTVIIIATTLVIIGAAIGIYTTQKPQQGAITITPTPTVTVVESPSVTPEPTSLPTRVAYITADDLWITTLDGKTNEKVMAITLPSQSKVTSLFWKNASIVTYAACTTAKKCTVYDANITQKKITPVVSDIAGDKLFGAWAGDSQLVFGTQLQGTTAGSVNDSLFVRSGTTNTSLRNMTAKDVFLDGYKDDIFTASKLKGTSKVIIHNIRAGDEVDNTFVIEQGKIVAMVKASSATLLNQQSIAFIYRDTLEIKDIAKNESVSHQIVFGLDETLFQIRAGRSGQYVSFWSPSQSKTKTFIYDIAKKERTTIHEQFIPEYGWVGENLILGRSTIAQGSEYKVNSGIAILDVSTKQLKGLVDNAVTFYAVEEK
jgi:hypothetical protein